MAFNFRFETIFSYRKSLEEQAQQKLAVEQAKMQGATDLLQLLVDQREKLLCDLEEKKKAPFSATVLFFYSDLLSGNERQRQQQSGYIEDCRQKVSEARKALLEKVKERKVFEKLREKELFMYLQETNRKEQLNNDEQVVLRYGRKDSFL